MDVKLIVGLSIFDVKLILLNYFYVYRLHASYTF